MKRAFALSFLTLVSFLTFGQVPEFISYQVIVRDASNNPLPDQSVSFRMSILKGSTTGSVEYSELHSKTTSVLGLVTLMIGNGTGKTGDFTTIDWGSDKYYIKVEVDKTGGTSYEPMGVSQLLSVPYALYAKSVSGSYYYYDKDNDGYGTPGQIVWIPSTVVPPPSYVITNDDCNDNIAAINPGAAEICDDNIDNNCNGLIDCDDPACTNSLNCMPVDVLLLLDKTGDMSGSIANLKASLADIINQLKVTVTDLAIGLASYQDFPVDPFGSVSDLPYQLYSSVSTNVNSVLNSMNNISCSGGGDSPESGNEALYQVATGAGLNGTWGTLAPSNAGFRAGSGRIVIVVTASTFHAPADYSFSSHSQAEAITALQNSNIKVMGISVGLNTGTRDLLSAYAIQTGATAAPSSGSCPTGINGGTNPPVGGVCPLVYDASSTGTGLGDAIVQGVLTIIAK